MIKQKAGDYQIVWATAPHDLEHKVNQLLKDGWWLFGPAQVSNGSGMVIIQTMIKE